MNHFDELPDDIRELIAQNNNLIEEAIVECMEIVLGRVPSDDEVVRYGRAIVQEVHATNKTGKILPFVFIHFYFKNIYIFRAIINKEEPEALAVITKFL